MTQRITDVIRIGFLALFLGLLVLAQPAVAQQPTSVNPTAQSVKEAQLLEALKPGQSLSGRATIPNPQAATFIQPGRDWRAYSQETLPRLGGIAFLGAIGVLALFYILRGKIRIAAGPSSQRILRFGTIERTAHWLAATSFIALAFTGANVTFGKTLLAPMMGAEGFAAWAQYAKYIHNYVGFAFMVGVALIFIVWAKDNIPGAIDVKWLLAGGGIVGKGHPPAKRFNGGQKIVFWSVVIGGFLLSLSGWHLLFPLSEGIGEIQWQATIHGVTAYVLIALMLAHAYIGSVGMEGAFDAMGSGEVDLNWAKEHHSLWVKEEMERKSGSRISGAAQPAERSPAHKTRRKKKELEKGAIAPFFIARHASSKQENLVRVIGFAGWSGAGKTTLLARLIPVLVARGVSVSSIKHAHHHFDVDHPGKDSYAHRMAGSREVLVSSANRFALMHELRGEEEWPLATLLGKLSPVDLVLVEGFKRETHPKIEVFRMAIGKPALHPDDPHIRAIATDCRFTHTALSQVDLDDIEAIATLALTLAVPAFRLSQYSDRSSNGPVER